MKKLFALLMALAMVLSMSVTAFATGTEPVPETGSITINGVGTGTTYEVYKLLDLESYDVAEGAYSYKVNAAWAGFFATDEAKAVISVDVNGYVTWTGAEDDDTKANFAKNALAHAKANSIAPVKSSKNTSEFTVTEGVGKFSGLELGYYLVDSTMGALCGLTTTNPDASINAKNGIPTIDKQVQEDSTEQWGAQNTADIGQIVEYRVTINVHAGAQNYVLHDAMADGLTFEQNANKKAYPNDETKDDIFRGVWKIEHVVPGVSTTEVTNTSEKTLYTVKTADLCEGTIKVDGTNAACDFEVHFSKEFCDSLETNDKIIVHYNAMLNRDAVVAGSGNVNTAQLTFGEGGKSNEDAVTTYTYGIDIIKTDSANKLIDGAKFRIYDAAEGGNEVPVVILKASCEDGATEEDYLKDSEGNYLLFDVDGDGTTEQITYIESYRRARSDETGVDIVVNGGKVFVEGFDNGTYYLHETEAPDGYNKLTARQKFIISDANLDATFNGDIYSTGSGVHVVNKTGSMLPETGGMGTVLFIAFGMTVVLGTGVLLVTKKRMSMIVD